MRRTVQAAVVVVLVAWAAWASAAPVIGPGTVECGEGGWVQAYHTDTVTPLRTLVVKDEFNGLDGAPGFSLRMAGTNVVVWLYAVGTVTVSSGGAASVTDCWLDGSKEKQMRTFWMMGAGLVVGSLVGLVFVRAVAP